MHPTDATGLGAHHAAASRASACLVAIAALLLGAQPAAAAFEGENGSIAFDREGDVWVMSASGKRERSVIDNTTLTEAQPAWSSNGKMLAFQEAMGDPASTPTGFSSIGIARANGKGRKTLTNTASTPGVFDEGPSWTPNGAKIVFERETVTAGPVSTSETDLYTVNVRTKSEQPLLEGAPEDDDPAVSPNGKKIAFVRTSDTVPEETIHLMKSSGGGVRSLTRGSDPSWSPDGKQIAFERDDSLYVITLKNGRVRQVPGASSGNEESPAWSPDGRFLLFVDEQPQDHIARVKPTGRRVRALTDRRGAAETNPDWAPR